jgi:hypothetical protein
MDIQNNPGFSGNPGGVPCFDAGAFDFEGWSQLAQRDVAGFFQARRTAIESFIASAPDHVVEGLRRLQNNIDNLRACAGSPLKATWQISGLMQDHVDLLGHQLDLLRRETERLSERFGAGTPGR